MKSGPFISLVADAYRVDEKTVHLYARFLKEAGLLTSGARGVNAPHMRPIDASRLTIALLATDSPARAVERLRRFKDIQLSIDECLGDVPSIFAPSDDTTIERALCRLFSKSLFSGGAFDGAPYLEIQENARTATIEHRGGKIVFRDAHRLQEVVDTDRAELFGIRRSRGVASAELMKVWAALAADRYDGFDTNGLPLALNHPWNAELVGDAYHTRLAEIEAYLAADTYWHEGA